MKSKVICCIFINIFIFVFFTVFVSKTIIANDQIKMDDGSVITFSVNRMRNDITGNFRIATTSKPIQMKDYALEYYKKYFKDDDEIHVIVNFSNSTTTSISNLGILGVLDVSIYEYFEKEEHDAKKLFSGMLLAEYYVDKETGKIENIR